MAVDIGGEAINRDSTLPSLYTLIIVDNPASAAGVITSIDIWANSDITGLRVGTFYHVSGADYKCRASEAIPGTIIAGSKVTKTTSIAVEIGDYIGLYFTGGDIELSSSGWAGTFFIEGEYIDPTDQATYDIFPSSICSLGGYIEGVAVSAPTVTTQPVDGIGFD